MVSKYCLQLKKKKYIKQLIFVICLWLLNSTIVIRLHDLSKSFLWTSWDSFVHDSLWHIKSLDTFAESKHLILLLFLIEQMRAQC